MKTIAAVLLVGLSYSASAMETAVHDDMNQIISQNIKNMLIEDQRRLTLELKEASRFTLPDPSIPFTRLAEAEKPVVAKKNEKTLPIATETLIEKPNSAK